MGAVSVKSYRCAQKPQYKWVAHYPLRGKRARRFFRTRAAALEFARDQEIQIAELGIRGSMLSRDARAEALGCLERLSPHKVSLSQAVDFYLDHHARRLASRPVPELVEEYLDHAERAGRSQYTLSAVACRLRRFAEAFDRTPAELTTRDVETWLFDEEWSPITVTATHKTVAAFLEWCRKRGFCGDNPARHAVLPNVPRKVPTIVSPEFMARLLAESAGDIRAFVALAGLCGLRSIEIKRLDWSAVKLDRGFVDLSTSTAKTASRRLVTILPAAAAWLGPLAKASGPIRGPNFKTRLGRFRKRFHWPTNALRHSFATYHLAAFENPAKTRLETGHSDKVLFEHYREVVTKETAKAWLEIMPEERP